MFVVIALPGQGAETPAAAFPLDSVRGLEMVGGKAEVATYRGRKAVRLVPVGNGEGAED